MARPKVSVIGSGFVGSTTAQRLAESELADVVLVDIVDGPPQGKALDLMETGPVEGYDTWIRGTTDYEETAGSAVVVITAGFPRTPGMSRSDLLQTNAEVVRQVTEQVVRFSPDCMIINVTNPLDVMTYLSWRISGFDRSRVMGMAGLLDSARFRTFIAMELKVSVEDVMAMTLGGHGDSMVPLVRLANVAGIPLRDLLDEEVIDRLVVRTRKAGAEIVGLLKTGSAYYSPSACAAQMVRAILMDKKRLIAAAVPCDGEYGLEGTCVGLPVVLGADGVERVVELDLTAEELAALRHSAATVKKDIDTLDL